MFVQYKVLFIHFVHSLNKYLLSTYEYDAILGVGGTAVNKMDKVNYEPQALD